MSIFRYYQSSAGRESLAELLSLAEQQHPDALTAPLLEKDLWVTELLRLLFGENGLVGDTRVAFKGGTALAKHWRAIARFSEDIDLSVHWFDLCPEDAEPGANNEYAVWQKTTQTPSQAKKFRSVQQQRLEHWAATLMDKLAAKLAELGISEVRVERRNGQDGITLQVHFPAVTARTRQYHLDYILLEFGARNRGEPTAPCRLQSYLADIPLFAELQLPVAEDVRIFDEGYIIWEKLTALHQFCTQEKMPQAARLARHWYDIDCLIQKGVVDPLVHLNAMRDVIEMKANRWPERGVDYAQAGCGGLCLVPGKELSAALQQDQADMIAGGMYTHAPDPFVDILARLERLEQRINSVLRRS